MAKDRMDVLELLSKEATDVLYKPQIRRWLRNRRPV